MNLPPNHRWLPLTSSLVLLFKGGVGLHSSFI